MKPLFKQGDVVTLKKFTSVDENAHIVFMNGLMRKAGGIQCRIISVVPKKFGFAQEHLKYDGNVYYLSPLNSWYETEYRISQWAWVSSMFECTQLPYLF